MIGLSSSWCAANGRGIYDSVKKIRDMGFELAEIGAAHRYEEKAFENLKSIKKDFGDMNFTVHTYFPPLKENYLFNPCHGLIHKNRLVINNLLKSASMIDAPVVGIHTGHLAMYEYEGPYREFPGFPKFKQISKIDYKKGFENAMNVFRYAIKLSKSSSVKFAIENTTFDAYPLLRSSNDFAKVFELIPELSFLYDIGHDVRNNVDTYNFFELKNKIVEVHMHDVVDSLDHRSMGKGRLDLNQISKNKELLNRIPIVFEHAANVSEAEILEEKQLVEKLLR